MEAWRASNEHINNRFDLRAMHALYGLSKGKTFSQIENTHTEENHPLNQIQWKIDRLSKIYQMKEEVKTEVVD